MNPLMEDRSWLVSGDCSRLWKYPTMSSMQRFILPKKHKKKLIKTTNFSTCVVESVKDPIKRLKRMQDYLPLFLTDKEIVVDKFGEARDNSLQLSALRKRYQSRFRDCLTKCA